MSDNRRSVWGDSAWLSAQSLIISAVGLVIIALAARLYGPAGLGELTFMVALMTLTTPIMTLGLDAVVLQSLVNREVEDQRLLGLAIRLRLAAGTALLIVVMAIGWLMGLPLESQVIAAAIFGALLLRSGEIYLSWFQARGRIAHGAQARVIAYLGTSLARLYVVMKGLPITAYAGTYTLDALLTWVSYRSAFRPGPEPKAQDRVQSGVALTFLRRSWPLILSGLAVSFYNRVDQVMLGAMKSDKRDAGLYAACTTLAELWYFLPMAVIAASQAGVHASHARGVHKFLRTTQVLYNRVASLGWICALGIACLSYWLLMLAFGQDYASRETMLCVILLATAGLLAVLGSARAPWLIAEGLQKYTLVHLLAGGAVNVALNFALIPPLGIVGAAAATLVSQTVAVVLVPWMMPATRISARQILYALARPGWRDVARIAIIWRR